jgi:hypothetical protein
MLCWTVGRTKLAGSNYHLLHCGTQGLPCACLLCSCCLTAAHSEPYTVRTKSLTSNVSVYSCGSWAKNCLRSAAER